VELLKIWEEYKKNLSGFSEMVVSSLWAYVQKKYGI
jgi:hypothetical protein